MRQREERRTVLLNARMRWGGYWFDACVRNLSSRGLMIQMPAPPEPGTIVELEVGSARFAARTIWSRGGRCGLRSQELDLSRIQSGVIHVKAERVQDTKKRVSQRNCATLQIEDNRHLAIWLQEGVSVATAALAAMFIAASVYTVLVGPTNSLVNSISMETANSGTRTIR